MLFVLPVRKSEKFDKFLDSSGKSCFFRTKRAIQNAIGFLSTLIE